MISRRDKTLIILTIAAAVAIAAFLIVLRQWAEHLAAAGVP
jgi:hypothetical protein